MTAMKPGDSDMADVRENRGSRVICGNSGTKSFSSSFKVSAWLFSHTWLVQKAQELASLGLAC